MSAGPLDVRIRALGGVQSRLGGTEWRIEVPVGTSARQAVDRLLRQCLPEKRGPHLEPPVAVFLNGRNIDTLSAEDTCLRNGDVLLLTGPVGGG